MFVRVYWYWMSHKLDRKQCDILLSGHLEKPKMTSSTITVSCQITKFSNLTPTETSFFCSLTDTKSPFVWNSPTGRSRFSLNSGVDKAVTFLADYLLEELNVFKDDKLTNTTSIQGNFRQVIWKTCWISAVRRHRCSFDGSVFYESGVFLSFNWSIAVQLKVMLLTCCYQPWASRRSLYVVSRLS